MSLAIDALALRLARRRLECLPLASIGTVSVNAKFSTPLTNGILAQYNVVDYGATGNGSTSDSASIQAAINAAQTAGGGVVFFPPGTYYLTAGLIVSASNITLAGAGEGATVLSTAHASTVTPLTCAGTSSAYLQNLTIRSMTIQQNLSGMVGPADNTKGVTISYIIFPKLVDVEIAQFGTALYILGTTDFFAERVRVTVSYCSTTTAYGIYVDGTTQNASCYFSHCISSFGAFTGTTCYAWYVHGTDISDLFLLSCEGDSSTYGFYLDGSACTSETDAVDIHLISFVADSCVAAGISINNLTNGTGMLDIDGAWAASTAPSWQGVAVNGSSGVRIRAAQIYGENTSSTYGVFISNSMDCIVAECIVKGTIVQGVFLDGSSFCSIVGNNFISNSNAGAQGVLLFSSARVSIAGNVVRAYGSGNLWAGGIYCDANCSQITAVGNVIDSASVTKGLTILAGATNIRSAGNVGINPIGHITPPALASGSGNAVTNNYGADATIYLTGASITGVYIGGTATGGLAGTFRVSVGQAVYVVFTGSASWQWFVD